MIIALSAGAVAAIVPWVLLNDGGPIVSADDVVNEWAPWLLLAAGLTVAVDGLLSSTVDQVPRLHATAKEKRRAARKARKAVREARANGTSDQRVEELRSAAATLKKEAREAADVVSEAERQADKFTPVQAVFKKGVASIAAAFSAGYLIVALAVSAVWLEFLWLSAMLALGAYLAVGRTRLSLGLIAGGLLVLGGAGGVNVFIDFIQDHERQPEYACAAGAATAEGNPTVRCDIVPADGDDGLPGGALQACEKQARSDAIEAPQTLVCEFPQAD